MNESNTFTSCDEFVAQFKDDFKLKSIYHDLIYKYALKPHIGKGYIERIILDNELEIWISNVLLKQDYCSEYKMPHNYFEISCGIKGSCKTCLSNTELELEILNDTIALFSYDNVSGYSKIPKNVNFKAIGINTNKDYVIKLLNKYSKDFTYCWDHINNSKIKELYDGRMVTEKEARLVKDIISFSGNKSSRLLYLYAKAIEFIALITQNIVQDDITNSKSRLDLDEIQILETVKSILINNMKKPPTIKSLARNVGISESKLKKDFKSYYGTTIFGYLRDKRLEHAKNLLYNKQLTIYEVANSVGFTNASKFAVAFRNKYGVNPSDTRKF